MNKLRVKCINCGKEWQKESSLSWGHDVFTSSLCDQCFRKVISPIIHKKQLREGNFDCFGKAKDYCDQLECKYKELCLRWKESEKAVNKKSNTG